MEIAAGERIIVHEKVDIVKIRMDIEGNITVCPIVVHQFHLIQGEGLGLVGIGDKREAGTDLKERKIGLNRDVDTDTVQTEFRCYADMDSIILGIDCLGEEEGAREDCCQNFFHKFVSSYISDANLAKKR